jgi:hypothetical protein
MTLRVSRSLLEAALLNMMNEEDSPSAEAPENPAPPAAPTTPEVQLDNAGLIAKKVEELKANKAAQISAGGRTFMRQGGKFFIKDIQITTQDLLGLLSDEAKTRVEEEIKKGAQSIGVRGDEFIDPVARGASFSSEGRGLWVDLAEVPIDVVAEYVLRDSGDIPDGAAYVTGEITETAGKHLVYRTNELAVVIPEGSKDVYIMSTQNDPNDPLGSALQLLKSVNILAEWRANPIRFYELVGTGPEVGKSFALQIDEKMKLGNFNKALKSIRTGAGKFFDFLNPFEGANIEVNFKFTELGPALVRTEVFGGKGGRIQAGGLTDKDLARLADTDYFRYEDLDTPVDTEYKLKKPAPPDPSDADPPGNPPTYSPERESIDISSDGSTGSATPNTMIGVYGFGRALWIYLKGYLEAKETAPPVETPAPVTPVPTPAADPNKPWNDEAEKLADPKYPEVGTGAVYYQFDTDEQYRQEPASYIGTITALLQKLAGLLPADANPAAPNPKLKKIGFYVASTADTLGEEEYNDKLAKTRETAFTTALKSDSNAVEAITKITPYIEFYPVNLGESPWKGHEKDWGTDIKKNEKRYPLRLSKVFTGPHENNEQAAKDAISPKLVTLVTPKMEEIRSELNLKESIDLDPLRRQIRKILLETMRR